MKSKSGRPTKHQKRYKNVGRPSVITKEVIGKLEMSFIEGLSDYEACGLVGVSKDALYDYIKKNPEFGDRKQWLKKNNTILAKRNLTNSIRQGDINSSKWYLERKEKDEFSSRTESTGKNGEPVEIKTIYIEEEEKEEMENHIKEVIK